MGLVIPRVPISAAAVASDLDVAHSDWDARIVLSDGSPLRGYIEKVSQRDELSEGLRVIETETLRSSVRLDVGELVIVDGERRIVRAVSQIEGAWSHDLQADRGA